MGCDGAGLRSSEGGGEGQRRWSVHVREDNVFPITAEINRDVVRVSKGCQKVQPLNGGAYRGVRSGLKV